MPVRMQKNVEHCCYLSLCFPGDILEMMSRGWKYFGGNFYYFSHIAKSWYSAEQFCISKEAHLTSVTSESEQEFLYKAANGLPLWIGLTKAGNEGDWYWVDKTSFNMEESRSTVAAGVDTQLTAAAYWVVPGASWEPDVLWSWQQDVLPSLVIPLEEMLSLTHQDCSAP
ncbi:C-type lectin domain family 4 member K-like [Peromyscus leucopus]|uniref:C-type lectin domain family 4 member K-like n=1 Tax=Peromyscus leucopus TaxID=10041 RepID=UPI001884FA1E|nr:C-type lectin domain family 4 member K-like [Peromyscus leucopus]